MRHLNRPLARMAEANVGSPTGREPYGDAGPVVVAGIRPAKEDSNAVPTGEGGRVTGHPKTERYA